MPLVPTPRRADWQRRLGESEPCHPGGRGASGGSGPASQTGLRREPGAGASGARAGPSCASARPGRRPGSPSASPGPGEPRAGPPPPRSVQPRESAGSSSGGPGEGRARAGCRAMEERREGGRPNPEPQARLRSREARGRRRPGSSSGAESQTNARTRAPAAPGRDARPPRHPEVCPSLLGLIVLARFLSPPPPPRPPPPCAPVRPPPPPPSLPPLGLSLLPALPSPHSVLLSRAHTFFLTHARRHILPFCALALGLPLSLFLFHFCLPCNLLKCCPFPVIRQPPRRGPPRARPLPLSPAFCLSRSLSPPPICYTEAPVNGLH